MNRLPKKRGITQDGEDKSLILRFSLLIPMKSNKNGSRPFYGVLRKINSILLIKMLG
jgi:hypothetical protein